MTDPAPNHPPPTTDVAAYVDELAARASGNAAAFLGAEAESSPSGPHGAPPNLDDARRHLDQAWEHAGAGTDVPDDARMRQVKKAVVLAMRPVTSHQVQFNQQLSVAVKELAIAVDALVRRVDGSTASLDAATTRVHAALTTVEVTVDDLLGEIGRLETSMSDLAERTSRMEDTLAADRGELRRLRARQDVVLRNAGTAIGTKAEKKRLNVLADELDESAELLADDLALVTRGTRDEVRAEVAELVEIVRPLAKGGVLDLGFGRGEWLDLLFEAGIEATGVDTSRQAVGAAVKRDLNVIRSDAVKYLAGVAESSLGVITAFHLVDRLPPHTLLELLDRCHAALRPGGLIILSAANPTAIDVGAASVWLDPARLRPMHPELLETLAVARGFGEAETRWLQPADENLTIYADDLAGLAPGRAAALADRLNQMIAGPRSFAILARKAGASPLPA